VPPTRNYRFWILLAARVAASTDVHTPRKEVIIVDLTSNDKNPAEHKSKKQHKMMDVNTNEVNFSSPQF